MEWIMTFSGSDSSNSNFTLAVPAHVVGVAALAAFGIFVEGRRLIAGRDGVTAPRLDKHHLVCREASWRWSQPRARSLL